MAGRGCNITVRLLPSEEDHCLSIALHTPLRILRQQLETITQIRPRHQVLVLRDRKDDNNDALLDGDTDWLTLRECGVEPDALITLHSMQIPGAAVDPDEEGEEEGAPCHRNAPCGLHKDEAQTFTLDTPIQPKLADHCYNGIVFDVAAMAPFEVVVTSVSVGGMLGHVRVFARQRPWAGDGIQTCSSTSVWGRRYEMDPTEWKMVANVECSPSWDKCHRIELDSPLVLLPGQRRGLYVHSNLPNDLGIQYQSYSRNTPFAQSEHVTLHPGLGHTSSIPFDREHGWYRGLRGLAGEVTYTAQVKMWSPNTHRVFPQNMQQAARSLIMCHYKNESVLSKLPLDVVLRILECCDWTWADIPDQDTVLVANHKAGTSQAGMELSEHAVGEDHSANMQRLFNHLFRTSDIWNGEVEFYINDEESDAEST
mmetsp:Transcript_12713/g.24117  ORF Transcript_12713/g.24117 Transcript_12713/m.24117 type:complete len:425 (-) Transcript_12713:125-1399(-)